MRYLLTFSYDGSEYFGFQIQPNHISVQERIEEGLSTILRNTVKIVGAGRTDTGVHAKKMYAHFDYHEDLNHQLVDRLNSYLPSDISILDLSKVKDDFHARFDATYRTYEYYVSLGKDPFTTNYSWQLFKDNLSLDKMNSACELLINQKDFSSFAKVGGDSSTNICYLFNAYWERNDSGLKFTISANRFLRNMVRAIVGTMIEIGQGKISLEEFKVIIEDKDRSSAGVSAPAKGLFLLDVGYDF